MFWVGFFVWEDRFFFVIGGFIFVWKRTTTNGLWYQLLGILVYNLTDKQHEVGINGRCKMLLATLGTLHYLTEVTIHYNKQSRRNNHSHHRNHPKNIALSNTEESHLTMGATHISYISMLLHLLFKLATKILLIYLGRNSMSQTRIFKWKA